MELCLQGSGDCACAAAKRTGISLEFQSFLTIFDVLSDVLSGIWCEFDVVRLLLEGLLHLLGTVLQ